jgi:Tol biopolymer transport system component
MKAQMHEPALTEFQKKVGTAYPIPDPAPEFVASLEQQLLARARALPGSGPAVARKAEGHLLAGKSLSHRGLATRRLVRGLAWGLAILALILAMAWGINHLLPGTTPGSQPAALPGTARPTIPAAPEDESASLARQVADYGIAFQSNQDGNAEIYRLSVDGGPDVNLTSSPSSDTAPAWSPDGQRIAFLSDRSGKNEIYAMQADGSRLVQLTDDPRVSWFALTPFAWSPDGRQIAAVGSLDGGDENHAQLYIIHTDGSGSRLLLESPLARAPKWSPDGRRLAFVGLQGGRLDLYTVDAAGGRPIKIPSGEGETTYYGVFYSFDWSPDGRQLVFLLEGPYNGTWPDLRPAPPTRAAFKIANADGSNPLTIHEIQPMPPGIRFASWSPDGSAILYLEDEKDNGCWTVHLLALKDLSTHIAQGLCALTRTFAPDWTPDGKWLVLAAGTDGTLRDSAIYALNVPRVLEGVGEPVSVRLTEADGLAANPQVKPGTFPAGGALEETSVAPIFYTVQPGDTLLSIAEQTGRPVEVLALLNGFFAGEGPYPPASLTPGQQLLIGYRATPGGMPPPTELPAATPNPTSAGTQGFDPAHSRLAFQWVTGGTHTRADIYAEGRLLGQVDFGDSAGGWCDRSWDGEVIAFAYNDQNLRWFGLEDVTEVRDPLPDYHLNSPPSFAPRDSRLAFIGCQGAACGLYVYDIASGELRKLSSDDTWFPPAWSPDGSQIAVQVRLEQPEAPLYQVRVRRVDNGVAIYTGRLDGPDSPMRAWGVIPSFEVQGTERCENPRPERT